MRTALITLCVGVALLWHAAGHARAASSETAVAAQPARNDAPKTTAPSGQAPPPGEPEGAAGPAQLWNDEASTPREAEPSLAAQLGVAAQRVLLVRAKKDDDHTSLLNDMQNVLVEDTALLSTDINLKHAIGQPVAEVLAQVRQSDLPVDAVVILTARGQSASIEAYAIDGRMLGRLVADRASSGASTPTRHQKRRPKRVSSKRRTRKRALSLPRRRSGPPVRTATVFINGVRQKVYFVGNHGPLNGHEMHDVIDPAGAEVRHRDVALGLLSAGVTGAFIFAGILFTTSEEPPVLAWTGAGIAGASTLIFGARAAHGYSSRARRQALARYHGGAE